MSLDIRNLRKQFGASPALDNVNLSVASGEFVALLGPSGCGKTTLLRTIAGLEFPDTGTIAIGGQPMAAIPARERGIGLVFQHYALFRHMTVARNIAFGLEVRNPRPSKTAIQAKVTELLTLMGIPELADRYPDRVSGGQRQRVALARALAIEPSLLLLDEPFGALDAKVRKNLRIWLRGLHDRMKLTTILVTHDQNEALEMADRVAILRAGRIEQIDTPDRLYVNPANAFVHEFLGESIRFDSHVTAEIATIPELNSTLPAPGVPDGAAIALLRPHELRLLPEQGMALVETVHLSGPLIRVTLSIGGRLIEALLPENEMPPHPGETRTLDLSRARIYPEGI